MGVQVQTAKAKQTNKKVNDHFKQGVSNLTEDERKAVDRLVEITMELKKYEPLMTEGEKIKARLASLAADKDRFSEADAAVLRGEEGVVEFSAPKDSRQIVDKNGLIGKLKDALGYEGLIATLTIPLGLADKHLSTNELAPFIETVKGSRSIKSIRVKDA